jgi:RNA polymerase sigma factor (sigma-70 family)
LENMEMLVTVTLIPTTNLLKARKRKSDGDATDGTDRTRFELVETNIRRNGLAWGVLPITDCVAIRMLSGLTDADDKKDIEDVKASLEGDGDAYRRLVVRYQNTVATQMWRFSRDAGVLEELVQEVFVQAYQSLKSYHGHAPFLHWLRRIATRVGYRYWKEQHRRMLKETSLEGSGIEIPVEPETISHFEAAETLHLLLAKMAPEDRLILTLYYLDECTTKEIAAQTRWTRTGVKVRLYRARNKLKVLLKAEGIEEE